MVIYVVFKKCKKKILIILVYKTRLIKILQSKQANKVNIVEELLKKYPGREHEVYLKVCEKYGIVPESEWVPGDIQCTTAAATTKKENKILNKTTENLNVQEKPKNSTQPIQVVTKTSSSQIQNNTNDNNDDENYSEDFENYSDDFETEDTSESTESATSPPHSISVPQTSKPNEIIDDNTVKVLFLCISCAETEIKPKDDDIKSNDNDINDTKPIDISYFLFQQKDTFTNFLQNCKEEIMSHGVQSLSSISHDCQTLSKLKIEHGTQYTYCNPETEPKNKYNNDSKLQNFLRKCAPVIEQLLELNQSTKMKSNINIGESFSDITKNRYITNVVFHTTKLNIVAIIYSKINVQQSNEETIIIKNDGLICVWDIKKPKVPLQLMKYVYILISIKKCRHIYYSILVSNDVIKCLCFDPYDGHYIIGGRENGCLSVWNLFENNYDDNNNNKLKYPIFDSECYWNLNHSCSILQIIHNTEQNYNYNNTLLNIIDNSKQKQIVNKFTLYSLDNSGMINIWNVIEYKHDDFAHGNILTDFIQIVPYYQINCIQNKIPKYLQQQINKHCCITLQNNDKIFIAINEFIYFVDLTQQFKIIHIFQLSNYNEFSNGCATCIAVLFIFISFFFLI
ncbi:hypothetical protein RFI_16775 [Reticulomyxa filosa]|uniref:Uncharacterized protein n=1 Tax=Reticulomyxa filosa TaxID=46433 RepID=X6N3I9_RETFI|nr:hypothetical protein RFI_16775 [Reticulomyxa filosa]|eukprot:ETO20443.1 hypothetical protein RFI_16775 [Reticulomyxa filosa]